MADISTNIKRLREQSGMTQEELAKRIGKTRAAISQYENGISLPRMGTVEDLAEVFGVSKAELVSSYHYAIVQLDESRESRLLEVFRKLDEEKQEQLIRIASSL